MTGTTASPSVTASAPPGQKSFCTSMISSTSSLSGRIGIPGPRLLKFVIHRSTLGGPDRFGRGDDPRGILAGKPRLPGGPQADGAALFRRPGARQGTDRNLATVRTTLPRVRDRHHHARAAGGAGADREFRQSGGAHLLALAADLESVRDLQARLERRGLVPDDRCGLHGSGTLLHSPDRRRGRRL